MTEKQKTNIEAINDCLPQTQCKLCTYDGCKPYAEAIINEHDRIDRCLPGGTQTLHKLAELTDQDASPFVDDLKTREKPRLVAVIREAECIGCTKCIQACPVDAILGTTKLMHTVIEKECTGCELCVEPCPVDCIDLIETGPSGSIKPKESQHYRQRYEARLERLAKLEQTARTRHRRAKLANINKLETLQARKEFIAQAVARAKAKRKP